MDPLDVEIKFKKGANGQTVCYSDSCPNITGVGPNEAAAANHFWKAFNKSENQQDTAARKKKHDAAAAAAATAEGGGKAKKAA